MQTICGIDIKSTEVIPVVLQCEDEKINVLKTKPLKFSITDDKSTAEIVNFHVSFLKFVKENKIDVIVIKSRPKKGRMAGGAESFKLEGLIQINGSAEVVFMTGQAIAAADKKEAFKIPENLLKYQETAFMAANLYHRKNR